MTWTKFFDMHSGGTTKEPPYQKIYIEASEAEAKSIFYARFGHNPERVTCTCCGEDYSITESDSLTVEQYLASPSVLAIAAAEITDEQRTAAVLEQGYVWKD